MTSLIGGTIPVTPEGAPDCPTLATFGIRCDHAHPFDPARWCPACAATTAFEDLIVELDPSACDCGDPLCDGCDGSESEIEGGGL